jgi:aspartokinase-like uncharacterized kinase
MTKITIDVEEIKKNLKARAVLARGQIEALAKRAQKDLSEKEIRKKIEEVLDRVKAQDFVKNKTFSGIVDEYRQRLLRKRQSQCCIVDGSGG